MSETSPGTIPPLVNHINSDGMKNYGHDILLGLASEIPDIGPHTKISSSYFLHHPINAG